MSRFLIPTRLWLATLVLALGFAVVEIVLLRASSPTGEHLLEWVTMTLTAGVVSGGIGGGLAALAALVPQKQKTYREKFAFAFPLGTSVVMLALVAAFAQAAYLKIVHGKDLHPTRMYEDIEIPAGLDCSSIRNGRFETDASIIERTGNRQTQTSKKTGEKKELDVDWVRNCELVLSSTVERSSTLRVKVVSLKPNQYGCYVISDAYSSRPAQFSLVRRLP